MVRIIRMVVLAGAVGWAAALTGCTAHGDLSIGKLIRNEGFTISGHSERRLDFILLTIRELEDIDRPH